MKQIDVPVECDDDQFPTYGSEEAAGADVRAAISQPIILEPRQRALIPTGIRCAIPKGYEIQVRPRSGLALKHGIALVNSPGTIDSDYRGEIGVIVLNTGDEPFTIEPGMRIAQFVLSPVIQARFVRDEALTTTSRGEGGFGHTGTN